MDYSIFKLMDDNPIVHVCKNKSMNEVIECIKRGEDPFKSTRIGSGFESACGRSDKQGAEIVKYLLENYRVQQEKIKFDPFECASGAPLTQEVLMASGFRPSMNCKAMNRAAIDDNVEGLKSLIRVCGMPVKHTADGVSALHRAAEFGSCLAGEFLIQSGADPLQKDNQGRIPLHYSAGKSYEMSEILVKFGGLDSKSNEGDVPLVSAVFMSLCRDSKTFDLLASHTHEEVIFSCLNTVLPRLNEALKDGRDEKNHFLYKNFKHCLAYFNAVKEKKELQTIYSKEQALKKALDARL